ncbi:MAG: type II toxin-antitoxin system HigB family toxin [Rhodothermia bacterium]
MQIYGKDVLMTFCESHADLRKSAERWLGAVSASVWDAPHDVKASCARASILSGDRVVFNLKGNKYRLVAKIDYDKQVVRIRRVGTHSEYSKWKL